MIAPQAEIFTVGAIEVALHRHVIDSETRGESKVTVRNPDQVLEIGEHKGDYKTGCNMSTYRCVTGTTVVESKQL